MANISVAVPPQASTSVLKRHEKMLDTIRGGTEKEAIALFSEDGYDVNTKVDYTFDDRKRYVVTPLAWAVRFKRPQLCRYLLTKGADPYSSLVYDYYPLHEACNRGFSDIVKIFIDMKCDIDRVTSDQHSPLHIACMRGKVECARLLLEAGANREMRNNKGQTPLQLGIYHGQGDLQQLFSHYYDDPKPRIQRRHSLHSPTGEPRHPMKQMSSMDSGISHHHRPQSMVIDYNISSYDDERTFTTDDVFSKNLQLPNGNMSRFRSHSNQNLASSSAFSPSSLIAQPHTCSGSLAPTNSQVHVTPATIGSGMSTSPSMRPTLIKQFSQASSCAADSPSPVEKDGVRAKNKDLSQMRGNSVEIQYTVESDSAPDQFPVDERLRLSPEKSVHSKRPVKREHYLGAPLHSSVPLRSKVAPSHSHSNPEFPLTAHISMDKTERTHSYDNLYAKRRQPPCQVQAEDKISPSREKINSLSSQIYSSLDQNCSSMLSPYTSGSYQHILKDSVTGSDSNPVCEVMQKIITSVTVPPLNLSKVHIQTLMDLSRACCHANMLRENRSFASYPSLRSSMSSSFSEGETVYDSPVAYLLNLGYRLVEKPLTVSFGVPCEGYMTLTFKLIAEDVGEKNALLKVVTKIFDLKNKYESSTYHHSMIDEGSFPSSSLSQTLPDLLELSLLAQLSDSPHPSVVKMVTRFKAYTSEQHELFAQQMNPDNPKKIYTTGRIADFIVLQSPKTSLREHLDVLRTTRKSLRSCEVFSEEMVLSVLSQVLLAVVHLVNNQIAHCSLSSCNIFIDEGDRNRILLSNFSHAIQLNSQKQDLERVRQMRSRFKVDMSNNLCNRHCVLSPEVVEAVENSELESAFLRGELKTLFAKNDTYGAGLMVYSWFLNDSHSFLRRDRLRPYAYSDVPYLSEFSPQCNHLLRKLVAYDHKERLSPMEGAMACFVLIFGPAFLDIKTEEECNKWLLAETVQFYMRPVLVDSKVRDYADPSSMLLCMYLTVASCSPRAVWEACRFLSKCSAS